MTKEEYIALTPIRLKRRRIVELKCLLSESDYKAIKFAEGLITEADYAETRSQREAYRAEINALEAELSEE